MNLDITRLGKEKPGYNRMLKIKLQSITDRDEFLKNAKKLKDAPQVWSKVYLKKDQHPVYIAENNRLRKKMYDLKKTPGYESKNVKLVNGKLYVGEDIVDRNTFFQ